MQTFLAAWKGLEEKLEEGLAFLGKPPVPLLLGLTHLASAVPTNILSSVSKNILRWLLPAVTSLMKPPLEDDQAVQHILRILQTALQDSSGRQNRGGWTPVPSVPYPL